MKINKFIWIFLGIILLIGAIIFFFTLRSGAEKATLGGQEVNLKVADSPEERELGLSNTDSLGENEGMIFLFDEKGYHSFWMKGMTFPIDIIFLNDDMIVTIHKNVPAPESEDVTPTASYSPTQPSNRVIEVPAGFTEKHNVNVGETVELSL